MLEWGFDVEDVEMVLESGETIEDYEDGSRLMLGRARLRPIHVVVAQEELGGLATPLFLVRWGTSCQRSANSGANELGRIRQDAPGTSQALSLCPQSQQHTAGRPRPPLVGPVPRLMR